MLIVAAVVYFGGRSPSQSHSANNARVVVGSKDFTESALLGEIVSQMLEARGVQVERNFELGGNLPHDALLAGKIDLYPEYTGTAFTAILKHPPITDPRAVYEQVKKEYAENFKLSVSEPLGFDNTFAILVRGADARQLGLKTISDAAPHARKWRAGFGQDFMSRADGYPGFAKAYELKFADSPREMDLSLTYIALASKQVDLIAGNSTEGRIAALDLFQLEDDRHYFPPYEAVYLVRPDSLERVPALMKSDETRACDFNRRNATAKLRGRRNKRGQAEVVREWIKRKGFEKRAVARPLGRASVVTWIYKMRGLN